jgi:hypothetical protein
MGMPVCALKRIMPMQEFEQWVLFHAESPIDDQSNHHWPIAQLTAYFAAANRGKDQSARPTSDFLLFRKKPEPSDDDGVSMQDLMGNGW